MNKVLHGVVLVLFGAACWFVSIILKLPQLAAGNRMAPAFTRLCMGFGPALLVGLTILATAYCGWVWTRKTGNPASWVAFLATTVGVLVFVMLPTIVAIYLPLADALNSLGRK